MCIFEVWLDFKLCWNKHIKVIKYKMIIQINALLCIMIFIWKVTFVSTWQIYSAVIRSVLIYKSVVWHLLSFLKTAISHIVKNIAVKLTDIQNKCLQVISEVYKIMLIIILEIKIYISSLNLYLNVKLEKFCQCHKLLEMKELVVRSCRWIQNKLQMWYSRLKFTISKY